MKHLTLQGTKIYVSVILLMMVLSLTAKAFAALVPPPLRLISFNAKNVENVIQLEWRTVGENNTDYFTVEQGTDGVNFVKVGSLKAAGIDPLNRYYKYTDMKPKRGSNYYRLAMYDLDGTVKYSATQLIKTGSSRRLTIAPNPVANSSTFSIQWNALAAGSAAITVFETNGRQMYKGRLDPSGNVSVNVRNWPRGVYCITLDNGIRFEFGKLVVRD